MRYYTEITFSLLFSKGLRVCTYPDLNREDFDFKSKMSADCIIGANMGKVKSHYYFDGNRTRTHGLQVHCSNQLSYTEMAFSSHNLIYKYIV